MNTNRIQEITSNLKGYLDTSLIDSLVKAMLTSEKVYGISTDAQFSDAFIAKPFEKYVVHFLVAYLIIMHF